MSGEVFQCESCEGKGADFYGTCWTCGGTGFVDADGFMAEEPLSDDETVSNHPANHSKP